MTVRNLRNRVWRMEARIDDRILALGKRWIENPSRLSNAERHLLTAYLERIETAPTQAVVSPEEAAVLRRLLEPEGVWASFREAHRLLCARSRAFLCPSRVLAMLEAIARHAGRDLGGASEGT